MSISNAFAAELHELILNASPIANLADDARRVR